MTQVGGAKPLTTVRPQENDSKAETREKSGSSTLENWEITNKQLALKGRAPT